MRHLILILSLISLIACNNRQPYQQKASIQVAKIKSISASPASGVKKTDTVFDEYPADSLLPGRILTTGFFHQDEVTVKDAQLKWIGLFIGKYGHSYTSPMPIKTTRVTDELADEGDLKTGWEVSTTNKDKCIIMVAGFNLPTHTVKQVLLKETEIMPGKEYSYQYHNASYTLYATGTNIKGSPDPYAFYNYRLFCKTTIKGKSYNELLAAHSQSFYDCAVLFIGDIDGDDIPDLLINTAGSENVEAPVLYLSKFADKGHIFKVAGKHTITGC